MNINDLVKVAKQPETGPYIEGLLGFIEDLSSIDGIDYALFYSLGPEGSFKGSGSVPLQCLSLLSGDEKDKVAGWKKIRDDRIDNFIKNSNHFMNYCDRLKKKYLRKAFETVGVDFDIIRRSFVIFEEYIKEKNKASDDYCNGRTDWEI